jgi:hypothetical protein
VFPNFMVAILFLTFTNEKSDLYLSFNLPQDTSSLAGNYFCK